MKKRKKISGPSKFFDDGTVFCPIRQQYVHIYSACLNDYPQNVFCRHFGDCYSQQSEAYQKLLSLGYAREEIYKIKFKRRLKNMFLLIKKDGSFELKELDPSRIDPKDLEGVEKIYGVSKEYVPVIRLVPVSQEEAKRISKEASEKKEELPQTPAKKRRRRAK